MASTLAEVAGESTQSLVDGYVLVEGLKLGAALEGLPVTLKAIRRYAEPTASGSQPKVWTSVEFAFPRTGCDAVAAALADCVAGEGGWYSHFSVDDRVYVIFADKIFTYRDGDAAARQEVEAYAKSVGVPEPQLDW